MAELILGADSLNTGRIKINNAIEQSEQALNTSNNTVSVANNAVNIANGAVSTANESNAKSDATQEQLDNIILESGTSDAEVVQARGGFPLLKDRLDNIDSHLSDTDINLMQFGVIGDGIVDDTINFQEAVNNAIGRRLIVPPGTYILRTVNLSHDITIHCIEGAVFKRKGGLDISQSHWNAGTSIFEVVADGLTIKFTGNPVFDGNKQNQPVITINPTMEGATTEPVGFSFKYRPIDPNSTNDCYFYFENSIFKNGTAGYLAIRGADVNRTFKTTVCLDNVAMTDTVRGYGKDDPTTQTALGWNSDYINIMDYVELVSNNLSMKWSQIPTPTGTYAPVGIRATFYGSNYNTSGQPILTLHGKTSVYGLGRKANNYNSDTIFLNNGIGAIDTYGNGESIYCENLYAEKCENVPLRAKSSLKRYVVKYAYIKDCSRGLQISTSSTGLPETDVEIGTLIADGGTNPQLEIVGNTVTDSVKSVNIGDVIIRNGLNEQNIEVAYASAIFIRYCENVNINSAKVENQDFSGIILRDINFVNINHAYVNNTGQNGVWLANINRTINIKSGLVKGTTSFGINISDNSEKLIVENVSIENVNDYGIFINSTGVNNIIKNVSIKNVTGYSRAFYFKNQGFMQGCDIGIGVTTAIYGAVSNVQQLNNSFDRAILFGTSYLTTIGTHKVGDAVYNSAPTAGGNIGWVCVTAGSPGTWKTFGTISA